MNIFKRDARFKRCYRSVVGADWHVNKETFYILPKLLAVGLLMCSQDLHVKGNDIMYAIRIRQTFKRSISPKQFWDSMLIRTNSNQIPGVFHTSSKTWIGLIHLNGYSWLHSHGNVLYVGALNEGLEKDGPTWVKLIEQADDQNIRVVLWCKITICYFSACLWNVLNNVH